jgi:Aspartyl protease
VFVDAIINGQGPFQLLVDTGSTTSLLAPDAAVKANLVYDHRVLMTALGVEKSLPATSTSDVRVGSAKATGVQILVSPIGHLRKLHPGTDGILGQNFLGRSAYLIDYMRKKLWLGEEAVRRAEELPFVFSALQINGRTILPLTLQAGGPSWRLTLDSGATNLILKCDHRCPVIIDQRRDERVLALLGERPIVSGTLRQIEIAGARMSFVPVMLVDTELSDGKDDGVIPSQWFSAVYVDGTSGLVRLSHRR